MDKLDLILEKLGALETAVTSLTEEAAKTNLTIENENQATNQPVS